MSSLTLFFSSLLRKFELKPIFECPKSFETFQWKHQLLRSHPVVAKVMARQMKGLGFF